MKWILNLTLMSWAFLASVHAEAQYNQAFNQMPGVFARGEVVCSSGDCLTNGWTTYAPGYRADTYCVRHDCEFNGWTSRGTDGGWSEVRCMRDGCLIEGWFERSNGYDFKIECRRGDCLTEGWEVTGLGFYFWADVQCQRFDCKREGWTYRSSHSPGFNAVCTDGACWESGWVIH